MKEHERIYDEQGFIPAFLADVDTARGLVLIKSTFLAAKRIAKTIPSLTRCIQRGVHVIVLAQDPRLDRFGNQESQERIAITEAAASMLTSIGVELHYVPKIHQKLAIIDDYICWNGTLNILSFNDTSEEMTRYLSRDRVKDTIRRQRLVEQASRGGQIPQWAVPQKIIGENLRQSFGAYLLTRRQALNLAQIELADLSGMRQATLSRIERGSVDAKLETIARLCHALDCTVGPIPCYLIPSLTASLSADYWRHPREAVCVRAHSLD